MAIYTKIPESNIAQTIGSVLGKAGGAINSTAIPALDSIDKSIDEAKATFQKKVNQVFEDFQKKKAELAEKISLEKSSNNSALTGAATAGVEALTSLASSKLTEKASNLSLNSLNVPKIPDLTSITAPLKPVKASLSGVKKVSSSIQPVIKTIKVPSKALKAAIAVIKAIPLPQAPLPVNVTTVFSDTLEMLSELAAQIDETASALESVVKSSELVITPVEKSIERVEKSISNFQSYIDNTNSLFSASDSDIDKMSSVGFFDGKGQPVLDLLLNSSEEQLVLYGNVPTGLENNPEFINKLHLSNIGGVLDIFLSSEEFIREIYKYSENKPAKPTSRVLTPDGWDTVIDKSKAGYWVSRATVSSVGTVGTWSDPEFIPNSDLKLGESSELKSISVKVLSQDDVLSGRFNNYECSVLLIDSEKNLQKFITGLTNKFSSLGVSPSIVNTLSNISFQESSDSISYTPDPEAATDKYLAPDGIEYTLEVMSEDSTISSVQRHYAVAKNPENVIVLEGSKTFSTDYKVLIEELKLRLIQLLG